MAFNSSQFVSRVRAWARELGFSQIGVSGVDLSSAEKGLHDWLSRGFHGEMDYMARHGMKRARPAELVPGTLSVITARMDYLPPSTPEGWQAIELARLQRPREGVVSLYARGRDYHKVLRARLQQLAESMARELGRHGETLGHRVFTDSAPVLEAELAVRSGLGWRGKHTLVLDREAGSMFFLGEVYVDLALPPSEPVGRHCGSCSACIDVCPTQAILGPRLLDARRCISYLTIEHAGAIAVELRPLMGNHIYGCDDCQLVCPWNRYAQRGKLPDFAPRETHSGGDLVALATWSEAEFLQRTEGSAIRRIGHERWQRNIAVALGNALRSGHDPAIVGALQQLQEQGSALVREHTAWALAQCPVS
ncbi:MAG: tRNA epoxyqueuosine(34) reductase QueG [Curvibacter sp.]|nr:tRNA epoxyqueuosine(34) reductase QueG [Curvibacter sp.]